MDGLAIKIFEGALAMMDMFPCYISEPFTKDILFPLSPDEVLMGDSAAQDMGGGMPCVQAVLVTSGFCAVLTVILLLLCRLYPMTEIELILDAYSPEAHVDAIRCHGKSLKKVTLKAFGEYQEEELTPIFQEVAELPLLETFAVDLRFPFSILSRVLKQAVKLKTLSLHLQLRDHDASGEDVTTLIKSIQGHPSLATIAIESSFFDSEFDKKLDPLLYATQDMPTLRNLSLCNLQCSPTVFSRVLHSKNLLSLELSNIPVLTNKQIEILQKNQTLKGLMAPLHPGTEEAWGKLIQVNAVLEELMLVVEPGASKSIHQYPIKRQALLPVARALGTNQSLQSFTFDVNENLCASHIKRELGPSLKCMQAIATSIAQNSSLNKLRLAHCAESTRQHGSTLQSWVLAVQQNYTLTQLELRTGGCCSQRLDIPEIDFYLKCNRAGRGNTLRRRGAQVANFVIQHRSDVSIVFHMLLEKPELLRNDLYAM